MCPRATRTAVVQQMIWEVDENLDDLIDYDEFQLTYYRNITDVTGNEPCSFFKILEVGGICGWYGTAGLNRS